MRRSGVVIVAGIVLAVIGAGAVTANIMIVRDQPGEIQSIEPVVATPGPTLPTPTPTPTPTPGPSIEPTTAPTPAPVPPAPPQDVDDDDDPDSGPDNDDPDDDIDNG